MKGPDRITRHAKIMHGVEYHVLRVHFGDKHINYVATSKMVSQKRIETISEKEPTTLVWIDSFGPDDLFVDIGANVGIYSLYAAVMPGCKVLAFEPEALNYAELNKNIFINGKHEQVMAYCCAVSDETGPSALWLSRFQPGYSHHDFDERRWSEELAQISVSQEARLPQGCVGYRLDDFGPVTPNGTRDVHIKIDVDGLEYRVIQGARKTLANPNVKSVLVEIDFGIKQSVELLKMLPAMFGFKWSKDQARTWRGKKVSEAEFDDLLERGKSGTNVIFYKDDKYAELFKDIGPLPGRVAIT